MLLVRAVTAIVDLAVLVMLVEMLLLARYHRRTGRGIAPRDLLGTLASGFFLVLALRCAMADTRSGGVAALVLLCLTLSLAAHVFDLVGRWDRALKPV